ncbi:MAG: bacteriohemerythrin [Caldimicrobium sp.]|jgi:hemerythrin-like metal-binding protein
MGLIEWNENFLTGIPEIDNQHKKIFNYLNNLYEYNKINLDNKDKIQKIQAFLESIERHFEYEESLIDQYNLENGEDHKREHAFFREKIKEIFEKYGSSSYALTFEICKFVKDFYFSHIIYYDKILAKKIQNENL